MNSLPEIDQKFKNFFSSVKHPISGDIKFDCDWQSFPCPESTNSKTSARYRAFSDGTPTILLHCHKCGITEKFSYKSHPHVKLPESERQIMMIEKAERERIEAENALEAMKKLWNQSKPCNHHPYFGLKQVVILETDGFRTDGGTLLCPVYLITGVLTSIQRIYWNNIENKFEKRFLKDTSPKYGFHILGKLETHDEIYFAEGPATAITIHNATNKPVICVYGKRFNDIAPIIAKIHLGKQLIFCVDVASKDEIETSENNAQKAISLVGGYACLPCFSMILSNLKPEIPRSDFNDLFVLLLANGLSKEQAHSEICRQLAFQPIAHIEILNKLSTKIKPIDFRKIADLPDGKNLQNYHFQIIIVEQVLALAKDNKWGICQNHHFIYLYNGAYWSLVDESELKAFLGLAAEKMGVDIYKARHFYFRDHLFKQFIALSNLPKPEHPKQKIYINLNNGTFEITPDGTSLKDFNSENFITYQLAFDYDPDAKAPIFLGYLDRVLPDKQRQNILSEFLGYVFIQPCTLKLEKTLLLYGTGANGKSVFYEIVRSLLGEQNTSEYSLQSLTDDKGYHRAMIANKLVNYASEINGKLITSIFKQLVSGEPVEARLPYGKPFTLTHYAKLIFNCNELPKDVEQTEAFFRRFLIIPFEETIPEAEQDKQLAQKIIKNELSGVFNWVLDGLKRLLEQKQFTDCEAVRMAREQYEKESDSVRFFLQENNYTPSSSAYIQVLILYKEYREICLDYGFRPVNYMNFIKRLERSKIIIEKKKVGKIAFLSKSF